MYKLYPSVKQQLLKEGNFSISKHNVVFFPGDYVNVFRNLKSFLNCEEGTKENSNILFALDESLNEESYKIVVEEKKIIISSSTEVGAYYATTTLKQIVSQSPEFIRCLEIFDEPDLKIRGFMMDISRNKVPKLETIKHVIDIISDLKMNHFELYVEGFSFEYKSFPDFLEKDGYITVEEYLDIEKYANERMVDLVPNQNGFGHMAKWLEKDEYKDLAEVPEGIFLWGRQRPASTLNPLDPRSIELVKKMYKDMLPISNSKYFNMNFDEPFELGKGKSKEVCEKEGLGNVYIDFALKAYDEIKKYNKIPMIWGDVLIHHPELLQRLPEDMIFLDWGYDANYPFNRNLKKLSDLKIKFVAAPGTTSWCSFLGRTNDWVENITNACVYTKVHNGEGVIVTDWGDFGHLQFLPTTYAPLVFTALMSWRIKEGTSFTLRDYLNTNLYKDENNVLADTLFELGNYYRYYSEYRSNGTIAFYTFMWANYAVTEEDPYNYFYDRNKHTILSKEKYQMLENFFAVKEKELDFVKSELENVQWVISETKHSIYLVRLINKVNYSFNNNLNKEEKIKLLENVIASKEHLLNEQKRLWLLRNKVSDLKSSLDYLEKFILFAEETLKYIREVK